MDKLFEQLIKDGYDIDTIQGALDAFKRKYQDRRISEARQLLGDAVLEYACALKLISPEEAIHYDLDKFNQDLKALEPMFLKLFTRPTEKIVFEPVAHAEEAVRTLDDNQILTDWLAGLG
jgi:hypothetical protein